MVSFAKTRSRHRRVVRHITVSLEGEWFIAEINQHGMVKPVAKNIRNSDFAAKLMYRVPPLLFENLFTQFVQNIGHVVVRITFRDEVDGRFPN